MELGIGNDCFSPTAFGRSRSSVNMAPGVANDHISTGGVDVSMRRQEFLTVPFSLQIGRVCCAGRPSHSFFPPCKILLDLCNFHARVSCATSPDGGSRDFVANRPVSPFTIAKRYSRRAGLGPCLTAMRRPSQSKAALRGSLVAILGAIETVWTAETEKTQNRQHCDQQIRVHHCLLSRSA